MRSGDGRPDQGRRPVGSVIVPAHNEAASVERCLAALFDDPCSIRLDVIVACNGCTDGTADLVRALSYPLRVLELPQASKAAALRAADLVARAHPRLYLDADVTLHAAAAVDVLERLSAPGALAARPDVVYDTSGACYAVRSYYRARIRTRELMGSLWGAGVYGLSERGRLRFGPFPDVIADDLFVDGLFADDEREIVHCRPVVVRTPRTTRGLLAVLRRSYRGQSEAVGHGPIPPGRSWGTLRGVVRAGLSSPRAAHDAVVLLCLVLVARAQASSSAGKAWERDESSRIVRVSSTAPENP